MYLKQKTLLLLFILISIPSQVFAASWNQVVEDISSILDEALVIYEKGEVQQAKDKVNDAYFGPFEGEEMEQAIRLNISAKRAFELEERFSMIKKLMTKGASAVEITAVMDQLKGMLQEDASLLISSERGMAGTFLYSFSIILREGFEAILLIAALIGYLIKSGNKDKMKIIYYSLIAAIFASLATALSIKLFFDISGENQEAIEGITMLIAVAVLFWVSYWLLSKVQGESWQRYIESKVNISLSKGNMFALWAVAFLAVYREGAETVLFYTALLAGAQSNEYGMIGLGMAIGIIVLIGVFFIVKYTSIRLPLKSLFLVTGSLMYILAFIFAGKGIVELQEADWITSSTANGVPVIDFLGIYPTWESLSLQLLLVVAVIVPLLWKSVKRKKY